MATDNAPQNDPEFKEEFITRQLSSAQTFITIAFIAGPVSVVIGGVFLSVIALVCGLVARSKVGSTLLMQAQPSDMTSRLLRQSLVCIFIAAAACAINIAYVIMMFPVMMEFLQSGDMQQALDKLPGAQSASSPSDSVWG